MLVLNSIFALGCVSRKTQNWEPALGQTAAPPNSSREEGEVACFLRRELGRANPTEQTLRGSLVSPQRTSPVPFNSGESLPLPGLAGPHGHEQLPCEHVSYAQTNPSQAHSHHHLDLTPLREGTQARSRTSRDTPPPPPEPRACCLGASSGPSQSSGVRSGGTGESSDHLPAGPARPAASAPEEAAACALQVESRGAWPVPCSRPLRRWRLTPALKKPPPRAAGPRGHPRSGSARGPWTNSASS